MKKDDSGPAFPMQFDDIASQRGMTLRDYFAAMCLQGFCANAELEQDASEVAMIRAKESYRFADAMLQERKQ